MPKPVCVPCRRFFRPKHNGIAIIEGMPDTYEPKPGLEQPDAWRPYKLWRADLWECKGCGAQIVVGFGTLPIGEHYQPDFKQKVQITAPLFQVNDC